MVAHLDKPVHDLVRVGFDSGPFEVSHVSFLVLELEQGVNHQEQELLSSHFNQAALHAYQPWTSLEVKGCTEAVS